MKKFKVKVTETLEKVIEVEATNRDEAISLAENNYYDSDPVLNADNFTGVKFTVPRERNMER